MILLSAPSFSRPMPKYNPLSGQLEKTWGILMPKFCSQKIHKENFKNLSTFESRCGIIYTQDKERIKLQKERKKMKLTPFMKELQNATLALMAEWQELHPEWEISHKNAKNIPDWVFEERMEFINNGLRAQGFCE